jgi:hypothetical protein
MKPLLTLAFWADAAERSIKTAAQSALLAFGADKVLDALTATWSHVGYMALGGAILSLLTSIASAPVSSSTGPASIVPSALG